MLAETLNEIVGPGQCPSRQKMRLGLFLLFLALVIVVLPKSLVTISDAGGALVGGEDTCYDWAEEYYRDTNAKEDEVKEEKFVPKAYMSAAAKNKRQPKKEKPAAKPAPVIQMPKAEPTPKEEQVSMFDLMGGMAG